MAADKIFTILYKIIGIDTIIQKQTQLNKALGENVIQTKKTASTFTVFGAGIQRASYEIDQLKSKVKPSPLGELVKGTPLNFLSDFGERIKKITASLRLVSGGGLKGIAFQLGSMVGTAGAFVGALLPILPILLLIGGAVLIFQRVWRNNIGGIQSSFFGFIGKAKDLFYGMIRSFDNALRPLAPLFKVIFGATFAILIGVLKLVAAVFKGVMIIIQPFIDIFAEIGELFGGLGGKSGDAMKIFEGFLKVIGFVAKGIAIIIRAILLPIEFVIKGVQKAIEYFEKLKLAKEKGEKINPFGAMMGVGKAYMTGGLEGIKPSVQKMGSSFSNTTNAPSVTINTSGVIDDKSAPRVADIISQSLVSSMRN